MKNFSFAIVVVCYNRLKSLKRLINSLLLVNYDQNISADLIFSIDNSGNDAIEKYAKEVQWPFGEKIVRTFPTRQGLKAHVLKCGEFTNQYDILAVLEDDLIVSDSFFYYAYNAASFYYYDDNVAGISLYSFQKNWLKWEYRFEPMKNDYDTYFMRIAQSWGQVWTRNKWRHFFDWYCKNEEFVESNQIPKQLFDWPKSSWLKYHTRYCIEMNKFFVYPYYGFSTNCGETGEHSLNNYSDYQVELQNNKTNYKFPIFSNKQVIYDEYMNRMFLDKYFEFDENVLIDLFETKSDYGTARYVLTTKKMNNKIVKKYSLSFHPIEYSIIHNIEGDGIYLYDLKYIEKNHFRKESLLQFYMRIHQSKIAFKLFKNLFSKDLKKFFHRIKKK